MTLLSKNSCFVKTGGRFFQILWPSHNILTLSNSFLAAKLQDDNDKTEQMVSIEAARQGCSA